MLHDLTPPRNEVAEFEDTLSKIREIQRRLGSDRELPGDIERARELVHRVNSQFMRQAATKIVRDARRMAPMSA